MASLVEGYAYDIFISYRQNDNRSGWVRQFVEDLREELGATLKDPVNIYFDENPHDGLQDTHLVDESLKGKLKCLIFIPILSRTYCDPKSFAWNHEFIPFCKMAHEDEIGPFVRLGNGNAASRILPVFIHDIDPRDKTLFEKESGSALRGVEFVFRSPGVSRPLTATDARQDNISKTIYRDQINKIANAIGALVQGLAVVGKTEVSMAPQANEASTTLPSEKPLSWLLSEMQRRHVFRAGLTYFVVAFLTIQALAILAPIAGLNRKDILVAGIILGVGFPVAIALAWMYEISPYGFIRTTSQKAYVNPFPPHRKKPLTSAPLLLVLVMAVILMAVYIKIFMGERSSLITIGVLSFENRSQGESDRYIAESLTEDVINRLIVVRSFRITSDTKFKHTEEVQASAGITEVARRLDVSLVLTGSVQRLGDSYVVRAKLYDINDERYVWGQTYERTMAGLVSVQSEIVQGIAERLNVELDKFEELRVSHKATESGSAYDHYLRGRSLYYKYQKASNDSAIAEFRKAIALDSGYARAWAGLGDALAQKHGRFGEEYIWTDSSLVAGLKAIALDSTLSEAYKAVAVAYDYQKHYEKSLPYLQKAVELNPTNPQAVGNLGTNYLVRGDLVNALLWEKKGAGLDPRNWIPYQLVGWIYRLLGDLGEAESWLKQSLQYYRTFDTYELLGYTYVAQGRKDQAMNLIPELLTLDTTNTRVLEVAGLISNFAGDSKTAEYYFMKSIERNPNYKDDRNTFSPIGLGQIRWNQGNRVEAEVYLTQAMNNLMIEVSLGSQSMDLPYYIAAIHAIRGNKELSLQWLQKAIDRNWVDYAQIVYGPYFVRYHTDPEFMAKVKALEAKVQEMRKLASKI
jgi:TolB-like protein/Tfp pilus assembly protein PilF